MARWTFGDGTRVAGGGRVVGRSGFADQLRSAFEHARTGGFVDLPVGPPPGAVARLDPRNDWMLDQYLRQQASRYGLTLETNYRPAHPPPEVRRILARVARYPKMPPDTVF